MRRPGKGQPRLITAIFGSAIVHILAVALVVFAGRLGHTRKPIQNVITTELVRIGKERPKDLLPRKEEPPPEPEKAEPPPQQTPKEPPPAVKPQPQPDAKPSAKDRLSQLTRVQNALDRLKSQEEPEGREDGSQYGTVSKALAGNKFVSEIYACMKANYTLEGMTAAQATGKMTIVVLQVDRNGAFRNVEISQRSGDARFDQNVLRSAQRCGKVSPPPPELADEVRSDGIEVKFQQ